MRIEMKNKRGSVANVLPDQVEVWEKAGWTATPQKVTKKEKTNASD